MSKSTLGGVVLAALIGASGCGDSTSDGGTKPGKDAGQDAPADTGAGSDGGGDAGTDSAVDGGSDAPAEADTGGDAGADAGGWQLPSCTTVMGTGSVTFTKDEGLTLAPTSGSLGGIRYTFGLIAMQTPNVLLAASGDGSLRSTDAGCTWTKVATLPSSVMILTRGIGDRAWAWVDNGEPVLRIDGTNITTPKLPTPNVIGFGAHATDPDHVRLGGSDGSLWEAKDGLTFSPIGGKPTSGPSLLAYRFAFDPQDLDHVMFGAATDGAWVSFDGGKLWKKANGLSTSGKANAFSLAVSPVDSNVVWAEAIDLDENLAGAPNEGRHIYRSTDGGQTFAKVVDHKPGEVTLTNGVALVPHPTDANVLYFEFGTYFQGYGTDLFRYDAGTDKLTKTHNAYDDLSSFAFSPADPSLMYVGITSEKIN